MLTISIFMHVSFVIVDILTYWKGNVIQYANTVQQKPDNRFLLILTLFLHNQFRYKTWNVYDMSFWSKRRVAKPKYMDDLIG